MADGYLIKTNITVADAGIRNTFNEIATDEAVTASDHIVPTYYDDWDGRQQPEDFVTEFGHVNEICSITNWGFNEDGVLCDMGEKFHNAISVLKFFIDTFFEPLGVKLTGTIVAVHSNDPSLYIYTLVNNTIRFDLENTSKFTKTYSVYDEEEGLDEEAEVDKVWAALGLK